jgi:GTP cyclohydrolase III
MHARVRVQQQARWLSLDLLCHACNASAETQELELKHGIGLAKAPSNAVQTCSEGSGSL